ncbi:hypothetical protein JMN32_22615 [Fulvivirga sp. 29W222]|uniref:Uncharacterized protein n=1 Tax=Fulvivirga marina TaxID=2494733 RepID=A0A937G1U3_9BACT|nr:hypothetical protein [Fulvivirga marina]MBL6449122.1 hypothetical protein [Fulvivirga marina]
MRAVVWILSICTVIFWLTYLSKDSIRRYFFANHVLLNVRGEADPAWVHIDWTSDAAGDTITIFEKGRELDVLYEARGSNTFMVYYKGKSIGILEHFKSNAFNPHTYIFELLLQQDSVYLDLTVSGPDATQ